MLEETVTRLEARLYELEHPNETTPAVTLHDPYTRLHEGEPRTYSPPLLTFSDSGSGLSPFSPISTTSTSSLPSGARLPIRSYRQKSTDIDYVGPNIPNPGRHYTSSPLVGTEVSHHVLCKTTNLMLCKDPPPIVVSNL